ncbi:MAG: hydrolase [Mucilaginibacter sp.]|nr:hydrolase [Mucilaginibacter sp.]
MISGDQEMFKLFADGGKDYLISMSVDNVIFGYHEKELKVLLFHSTHYPSWRLPGGYIKAGDQNN